jgi:hypothetical protein
MFQGLQNGNESFAAYGTVLELLSTESKIKNDTEPLKKHGDLPESLPFHPLPEEMPIRQLKSVKGKGKGLTGSPEDEAENDGVEMTYGAALAVLSLIESFYELGVHKNDKYITR